MPCAQICKEILDSGAAVKRAVNCLTNTTLLHAGIQAANLASGKPDNGFPPADLIAAYKTAAEAFAMACAALERSMPLIAPGS